MTILNYKYGSGLMKTIKKMRIEGFIKITINLNSHIRIALEG